MAASDLQEQSLYHIENHASGHFIIHSPTGEKMHEVPLAQERAVVLKKKLENTTASAVKKNMYNPNEPLENN